MKEKNLKGKIKLLKRSLRITHTFYSTCFTNIHPLQFITTPKLPMPGGLPNPLSIRPLLERGEYVEKFHVVSYTTVATYWAFVMYNFLCERVGELESIRKIHSFNECLY